MGISALRTVFSLAWVAGPPLAAFLLAGRRIPLGLRRRPRGTYAVAAAVATSGWLGEPAPRRRPARPGAGRRPPRRRPAAGRCWLAAVAFTLLQMPLTLGVQALPLFVSPDLDGDVRDAGLLLGLCAALEIPLMLASACSPPGCRCAG